VVLSVGLEPPVIGDEIARTFGIELNQYGFAKTSTFSPLGTSRPGVYAAAPLGSQGCSGDRGPGQRRSCRSLIAPRRLPGHPGDGKGGMWKRRIINYEGRVRGLHLPLRINIGGVVDVPGRGGVCPDPSLRRLGGGQPLYVFSDTRRPSRKSSRNTT